MTLVFDTEHHSHLVVLAERDDVPVRITYRELLHVIVFLDAGLVIDDGPIILECLEESVSVVYPDVGVPVTALVSTGSYLRICVCLLEHEDEAVA